MTVCREGIGTAECSQHVEANSDMSTGSLQALFSKSLPGADVGLNKLKEPFNYLAFWKFKSQARGFHRHEIWPYRNESKVARVVHQS